MNLVNLLLRPRLEVRQALSQPNAGQIALFNVLPALLSLVIFGLLGLGWNLMGGALSVFNTVVITLVLSLVIYLVGNFFAKGKLQGKFLGLVHAVSLVWVTSLILMVIIAVLYFSVPGLLAPAQEMAKGIITPERFIEKLAETVDQGALFVSAVLGIIVTLAWMVHSLVVWFLALEEGLKFSRLKNLGLYIVTLVVAYIILEIKFILLF